MTAREALIERAVAACFVDTAEEESLADTLGFDENYARKVVVPLVLDAILPQVTTVAELEALPAGANFIGAGGQPGQILGHEVTYLVRGKWRRHALWWLETNDEGLLPLTVVWQPEVTA